MEREKWPAWLGIGAAPAVTFFIALGVFAFLQDGDDTVYLFYAAP